MGFRFSEMLLEIYRLFFKGKICLDSLRIEIFCSLTQTEELMEKKPPLDTLTLLCIINLWCSVHARSDLAMGWHKLFFGYPTSLNLPHLLQLQLAISCVSLNVFRQPRKSEVELVTFSCMCWQTEQQTWELIVRQRGSTRKEKSHPLLKPKCIMRVLCIVFYSGSCHWEIDFSAFSVMHFSFMMDCWMLAASFGNLSVRQKNDMFTPDVIAIWKCCSLRDIDLQAAHSVQKSDLHSL